MPKSLMPSSASILHRNISMVWAFSYHLYYGRLSLAYFGEQVGFALHEPQVLIPGTSTHAGISSAALSNNYIEII